MFLDRRPSGDYQGDLFFPHRCQGKATANVIVDYYQPAELEANFAVRLDEFRRPIERIRVRSHSV
jgi:hypothetical protein